MEKTIFILREVAWTYYDEPWLAYAGANEIYKKFSTYQEALAEKNRLEIDMVRHHNIEEIYQCNANFGNVGYLDIALKKGCYDYFKDNFGIDWQGIRESGLVDESKLQDWEFSHLANDFIRKKVLQDDKHILFVLDMIELDFYEISEVKEYDGLYKLFTNVNFKDFNLYDIHDYHEENPIEQEVEVIHHEQIPAFYYISQEDAQYKLCDSFNYLLVNKSFTGGDNPLKGSLSDLSEAPEMLKIYIENYADYFVYDAENQQLSMNRIHDNETMQEVMRGFVALLRPEKVPFIIKSFPISEIPEKYLAIEEQHKEEERRKQEQARYTGGGAGDLPF